MNVYAVTCGHGSTSSDSNRKSKSAPESTKTSCNCCWFIAVLIAANILLDLCSVAVAAYAILSVKGMSSSGLDMLASGEDGHNEVADGEASVSVQTLIQHVNATQYQLMLLEEEMSALAAVQANRSMESGEE